ncbi:MAG: serine/threonine-protein kinase [Planctomycetota bacterium]
MTEEDSRDDAFHLAGDRLGKFTILSELGRGSMGVVYEAFQEDLKRKVALKVLPANIALEKKQVERFRREAESAARLRHDNIIPIYEIGHAENTHYFVMELVDGGSMTERCRAHDDVINEAARVAHDCASGLAHAHERGVIHRDIKPANILVARDGRVVITDFGLARITESMSLTSTDAIVGTPKYMSPEQILRGTEKLDGRSDIYSLGAALYEVVAGRPPIDAPSVQAFIRSVLEDRPPNPRRFNKKIPHDLATIILRCLEKNAADRYQDGASLVADLQRFLSGERIHAKPKGIAARSLETVRRHRVIASLSAVAIVAGISALALWQSGEDSKRQLEGTTQELRFSERIAEIRAIAATNLGRAIDEVEKLVQKMPDNAEVTAEREGLYARRAQQSILDGRFGPALEDLRRAGTLRDPFWFQMMLIEVGEFDEAKSEAEEPGTADDLRKLTLARAQLEQDRDFNGALDTLADVERDTAFHHLTRAEAHYSLGIQLEQVSAERAKGRFAGAQDELSSLFEGSMSIREPWLLVRIKWFREEVRARLGKKTNLGDVLLGLGGSAQESIRQLTRLVEVDTEAERDNVIAYVRAVLGLHGLGPETLAAVMQDEAEKRLEAAKDPATEVRAYLLSSVAYLSSGQLADSASALAEADDVDLGIAETDELKAYLYWGRSLLGALVRQGYDTQALHFSIYACDFALGAEAFPHRVQLVTNSLLLAERALALGRAEDVESAKQAFLRLPEDLQQLVAGYLAAVNAAASDPDPDPAPGGDDGPSDPQEPGR